MDKKITRRVVLGTTIAGLVAGPFVIRAFRRTRELPPSSFLANLRSRFEPALDFPRKFDYTLVDWNILATISGYSAKDEYSRMVEYFHALPQATRDTIADAQRRYWQNFANIDELEFDCSHFYYNSDGTKKNTKASLEGHVRMKYGYGLEIVGKNAKGEPIHWVFNLDGDISPVARVFNLSNMMLEFFTARRAFPSEVLKFDRVYAVDADLPNNSYLENAVDEYTILSPTGYLQNIKLPSHIEDKIFYGQYYNNRTGMLDYCYTQSFFPDDLKDDVIRGKWNPRPGETGTHLNPQYENPSVPLPPHSWTVEYWKNVEIEKGIFLPVEYAQLLGKRAGGLFQKATYSNIRVKMV